MGTGQGRINPQADAYATPALFILERRTRTSAAPLLVSLRPHRWIWTEVRFRNSKSGATSAARP